MKKIFTATLALSSVMILSSCATHGKFVQKYNAWVGQNINYFIDKAGYPDSTFTLPNNNKVYIYEESRVYSQPSPVITFGYGGYGGYRHGGMFGYGIGSEVTQESCKLFIETNKKGKIIKWKSRGNHCISE